MTAADERRQGYRALVARAIEVVAECRNLRGVAVFRRALWKRTR